MGSTVESGGGTAPETAVPDVTVIVAVYNTMPYLTRCLDSLVRQSIGRDRVRVIAVDDGSTDGGGAELDRYAGRYPDTVTVVHQPNSGGPAAPSNRALCLATGRYVFFVGADDYLGREALERMVRAADEHDADVVVARMVGVNGRYVPKDVFAAPTGSVDLFDSALPFAMSNTKLFRRDLIEKHGIRYPEEMPFGSDQPFTLEACVHAGRISVLADYDYYHAVRRANSGNITFRAGHEVRLRCTETIMANVARLLEPGPRRDAIMFRSFSSELSKLTRPNFLRLERDVQERVVAGIARLVDLYMTEPIRARLDVGRRVRLALAARGDVDALATVIGQHAGPDHPVALVEDGRLYLAYRCFRDPAVGLPDDTFLVSDVPAAVLAGRFDLTATTWDGRYGARRTLTVTLRGPAGPDGAALFVTIGAAVAPVRRDGTAARAVFRLADILAAGRPLGDGLQVRLRVVVDGTTADVPVRKPAAVGASKAYGRMGPRLCGVKPTRHADGDLMVTITPVTRARFVGRCKRMLRRLRRG